MCFTGRSYLTALHRWTKSCQNQDNLLVFNANSCNDAFMKIVAILVLAILDIFLMINCDKIFFNMARVVMYEPFFLGLVVQL